MPDVKLLNVKSMLFDNCTCAEASIGSIDFIVSLSLLSLSNNIYITRARVIYICISINNKIE